MIRDSRRSVHWPLATLAALVLGLADPAAALAAGDEPPPPAPPEAPAAEPRAPAEAAAAPATSPAPAQLNPPPQAGVRRVRLSEQPKNVIRSGPGERFSIVGLYPGRSTFPIIAKSGDWYNVRLSDTETGWVHTSLCEEYDDASDLEFRPNPKLFSRTGSFVLTGFAGAYAFDRKSNSLVLGGRVGYYVFDRVQVEGALAWTHIERPAEIVESLFDLTLEAEDFHMLSYHLVLNYELFPGRQMVPFISAGLGSSIMQGRTEPSLTFGAGTSMYFTKRWAVRFEFRNYRFESGIDDARFDNNNVEFTVGTSVLI
jgi:outer membrane beta-barrel protein